MKNNMTINNHHLFGEIDGTTVDGGSRKHIMAT